MKNHNKNQIQKVYLLKKILMLMKVVMAVVTNISMIKENDDLFDKVNLIRLRI